jgi:hypothetical protein
MRRFPWLVPAISIALTVVMAAVAAIIGLRFAAPEPALPPAAIETEVVPVIAPVASADLEGDDEIFDVSQAIGEIEVPVAGSGPDLDPDAAVAATIEAMAALDDPIGAWDGGVPSPTGTPAAPGDPCATETDDDVAEPTDCPEGLRSAIFGLTAPPPLWALPLASPPTREELIGPGPGNTYCPAVELTDGEISFGVGTNTPGTVTVRYWPITDPSDIGERVLLTAPADRAAWDAGFAVEPTDYLASWYRPQHCTVLDGLVDFTQYRAEVVVLDQFGREFTKGIDFYLTPPRVPPVRVLPVGDRDLFVSAPHTSEEVVDIAAYVIPSGVPASRRNCAGMAAGGVGQADGAAVSRPTDPAYNERNGFLPQYDRRTTANLRLVRYGVDAIVCIRWFDVDRPSFDTDRPFREYEQFVSNPDPLQPVISVDRLDLVRAVRDNGLFITGRDLSGGSCGSWRGPAADDAFSVGTALAPGDRPAEIVCEPGTSANVVVITSQVTSVDGAPTAPFAISVPASGCAGAFCESPEPLFYRVPLADVRAASGLCGSSFGSCEPPTRLTSVGTATFRLDWVRGNGSGATEWTLEAARDGRPDTPRPDAPQLDTSQSVRVTEGRVRFTSDLSFDLIVDRPVDYRVRIIGDCKPVGLAPELTGRVDSRTTVVFENACIGARYQFEVQLVGDDGTTSTWGPTGVENWWESGAVEVPGQESRVVVSLEAKKTSRSFLSWAWADLDIAGSSIRVPGFNSCVDDRGIELREVVVDGVELSTLNTVTLTLVMQPNFGRSGSADGPVCTGPNEREPAGTLVLSAPDVPIEGLYARDGFTMTAPDGGEYTVRFFMRAGPGPVR